MSVNKYVIIFARYTIIIDWKWKLFYGVIILKRQANKK